MSKAASDHLRRVAELPCRVCQKWPVQVHHIRMAEITGMGQKASHWLTFPLCHPHHAELHAGIKTWEMKNGRQIDHVASTLERLYGSLAQEPAAPKETVDDFEAWASRHGHHGTLEPYFRNFRMWLEGRRKAELEAQILRSRK